MPAARIALTGNTIVEATLAMLPGEGPAREIAAASGVEPGRYVLATIHRPENTDDPRRLGTILDELGKLGLPVLFPLHPRTRLAVAGTAWAQHSTGCGCSRRPARRAARPLEWEAGTPRRATRCPAGSAGA